MQRLTALLLLVPFFALSQPGSITDPRDGNIYATIKIGNTTWFREPLRLITPLSYYNNLKDTNGLHGGNYYAMQELNGVCPAGWHVSTITELEDYIQWLAKTNNIPDSAVSRTISRDVDSSLRIVVGMVNPYTDTVMRFEPQGWVQGKKLQRKQTVNFWLTDTKHHDTKFHAHVGALGFIIHTHKHNIIDKKRLVRRFNVRCTCTL